LGKAPGTPFHHFGQGRQAAAGQLIPTRISEMPITRMMVPVTTGGNSGSSRLMKGAA